MHPCRIVVPVVWLALLLGTAGQMRGQEQLATRAPRFVSVIPSTHRLVDASQSALLKRQVSLDLDGAPLTAALDEIANRAGIRLIYSRDQVPAQTPVTLKAASITLGAALTAVLYDTGLDVVVSSDGQMALAKKPPVDPRGPQASGRIVGRVTDRKSGSALVGASVVVEGTSRSATTGNDGRYRIAEMAPGTYVVRARYIGYLSETASVTVAEDQEATADLALEKSVQRLDEVVTTGTLIPTEVKALPTPITVITAEDIERLHPRRFDQLLQLAVPGAVVWEPDATDAIYVMNVSLRGVSAIGGGSPPKVYIDGIETAQHISLSIDPQSIERIEVLRGPQASAVYGSDAMGGVIQIFTKRGAGGRQGPQLEAQAGLGRVESAFPESGALRQEYAAAISGNMGPANYRIGGGYRRTGAWTVGFKESTPSLNAASRFEQGPLTVDLTARFEQSGNEPGSGSLLAPAAVPQFQRIQTRFETYGAQVAYQPLPWWQHSATVGVDRLPSSNIQYQRRLTTPADTLLTVVEQQQQRLSVAYRTTATATLGSGISGTLTAGADHYVYTLNTFFTDGAVSTLPLVIAPGHEISGSRARTTNTGVFAQAAMNLRETLFLTGALRIEGNSDFGSTVHWPRSTKVGLTYVHQFGAATMKLRTSYGEAIRPPTFGTKDSMDISPGVFVQLPSPGLRPEQQIGPDAGLDLVLGRRGSLSVTYYHQTAKDLIDGVTNFQVFPFTAQYINVARVKNTGWEFEGTLELDRLTLRGNFAVTHSRPEDLGNVPADASLRVGQQMQNMPWHTAGLTLNAWLLRRTGLTAGLAYQGKWLAYDWLSYYACTGGTGPCPSVNLADYYGERPAVVKLNLAVDQQLTRMLAAYLNVEDVTNQGIKRGRFNYLPLPGRVGTIGVRVRY